MMHGMMGRGGHGFGGPGVHGTVTAVNGTTLTVQDKDGKTYTVEAAGATAAKIQKIAVTDVQVGDSVEANGTLTGSTLTAKHLMDGVMEPDQAPTK
jgi:riboflavin synthase alpha subunit